MIEDNYGELYEVRLVIFHNGDDTYYAKKRVYHDENYWPSRIEEADEDDYIWNNLFDNYPDADYYGWKDTRGPSLTTRTEFP